ncbi:MAG: hypothetical protein ABJP70_10135 [Erythrobacter sp.]
MNKFNLAAFASLAALVQAQAATAQASKACVKQADIADAVVYAAPGLVKAAKRKCASELSKKSFLMSKGDKWAAKFVPLKNASWPGTKRIIKQVGSQQLGGSFSLDSLPDSMLRPIADQTFPELLMRDFKKKDCAKVDRMLELASPLPPKNVGALAAAGLELTGSKKPVVCPYTK